MASFMSETTVTVCWFAATFSWRSTVTGVLPTTSAFVIASNPDAMTDNVQFPAATSLNKNCPSLLVRVRRTLLSVTDVMLTEARATALLCWSTTRPCTTACCANAPPGNASRTNRRKDCTRGITRAMGLWYGSVEVLVGRISRARKNYLVKDVTALRNSCYRERSLAAASVLPYV